MMRFLYVMDPMCGWCYAFQPELEAFLNEHAKVEVDWIMGGLAPDSNQPMNENQKKTISSYWYQIEEHSQVTFNHDFWKLNTPYRSTYPACRAVIAAEKLKPNSTQEMVKAIQSAYYSEAKNPSLEAILVACATSIGLAESPFLTLFKSNETEQQLQQQLSLTIHLKVRGFPALFFVNDRKQTFPLTLGFCRSEQLEQNFLYFKQG